VSLTITFDTSKLRVRSVQQGGFMRTGGVDVTFTQQVNAGRIDLTLLRAADATARRVRDCSRPFFLTRLRRGR